MMTLTQKTADAANRPAFKVRQKRDRHMGNDHLVYFGVVAVYGPTKWHPRGRTVVTDYRSADRAVAQRMADRMNADPRATASPRVTA